ncbi:MAG: hypothetical protein ACKO24_00565 [Leptolyngbyaceae cyanobacterium]
MSEVERPSKHQAVDPVEVSPVNESIPVNEGGKEVAPRSVAQLVNSPDPDGWETVNFPGAKPIQKIPLDTSVPEALSQQPCAIKDETVTDPGFLLIQLQRENQELRSQVAQMTQDLGQEQIERQLVQSNLAEYGRQTVDASSLEAELTDLQKQFRQQTQELELAQQANQRQEILVDTLSKQLESSQERNAQLERECALIQEKYSEQVQQLLQSEAQCRDLRTRLHRQQQQTLQFKVALEKSLEMSTSATPVVEIEAETGSPGNRAQKSEEQRVNRLTELINLQNPPVQPWSAAYGNHESRSPAVNPLSKLLNGNGASIQLPGMEEMVTSEPLQPTRASVTNPIFDLEPFIKAGEVNAAIVTGPENTQTAVGDPEPDQSNAHAIENNLDDDPLWRDLARLIEEVETSVDSIREQTALSAETASGSAEVAAQTVTEAATDASDAKSPFKQEIATVSMGTTAWPAPVVYPTRSTKKIPSLAAVDLPMFLRPENTETARNA